MSELERIRAKKMEELRRRASSTPETTVLSEPFDISDATFDQERERHELLLVDFWAPWCGPCRMVAPILRQLAKDYAGKVAVGKLNTDENPAVSMRFRVMSIPTLMLFKNGKSVDVIVGAAPRPTIEGMIQRHLN